MARQERTQIHDDFQDEVERLAEIEDQNAIVAIVHELIRHSAPLTLHDVRRYLLTSDGIEIPSISPSEDVEVPRG